MHISALAHHLWTHSGPHIQASTACRVSGSGLPAIANVTIPHGGSGSNDHSTCGRLVATKTTFWIVLVSTADYLFSFVFWTLHTLVQGACKIRIYGSRPHPG